MYWFSLKWKGLPNRRMDMWENFYAMSYMHVLLDEQACGFSSSEQRNALVRLQHELEIIRKVTELMGGWITEYGNLTEQRTDRDTADLLSLWRDALGVRGAVTNFGFTG